MANRLPYSKEEVDKLVREPKYIKEIPTPRDKGSYFEIRIPVYRRSDKRAPVAALEVTARQRKSISGAPKPLPSVALEWKGMRIRGIDREAVHDNPDGTQVFGWHEHEWSEEVGDSAVIPAKEPRHKDMRGILSSGLKKWNIEVQKEQGRLEV
jgi:hypothetical protein